MKEGEGLELGDFIRPLSPRPYPNIGNKFPTVY